MDGFLGGDAGSRAHVTWMATMYSTWPAVRVIFKAHQPSAFQRRLWLTKGCKAEMLN